MNANEMIPLPLRRWLNKLTGRDKRLAASGFVHDFARFWRHSGFASPCAREALLAKTIMAYHVIEKGLTMPERRLGFGKDVVKRLMRLIDEYVELYGFEDGQVRHAVGVLKEYRDLHATEFLKGGDDEGFWRSLNLFLLPYAEVDASCQLHVTRDAFFSKTECSFPAFAESRHTVRNYAQTDLPVERIVVAVQIAQTAPSACNRQYVRVHCVSDKGIGQRLLALQKGNRGFGQLANKVLVVTVDLEDIDSTGERNDVYTNGGIFLMNLCYALHYCKVAHCVLNWSRDEADDNAARALLGHRLKESETIVALLSCGIAPREFDVAVSPRKALDEILVVH